MQVDTTRGITAGRWIRLYATKPLATGPRRQLLGEEQEGRERVKVQVEPWEAEAEMELWEEEEEPQPQPISRRQLTEKQQATSEDDGGSSSGSSKKKGSKRRMCGRKGDRHRCRRIRKAMKEWEKEAEALGLGQPEVPGASSSGEEGDEQGGEKAPATSAAGTLDAYIFFNNAVDSGKCKCAGLPAVAACCLRAPAPARSGQLAPACASHVLRHALLQRLGLLTPSRWPLCLCLQPHSAASASASSPGLRSTPGSCHHGCLLQLLIATPADWCTADSWQQPWHAQCWARPRPPRCTCRVSAVGSGWIELERPLPYDLRPEWQVRLACPPPRQSPPRLPSSLLLYAPFILGAAPALNLLRGVLLCLQLPAPPCFCALQVAVYSFEHSVQHVGYEDFTVEFQWGEPPACPAPASLAVPFGLCLHLRRSLLPRLAAS